MPYPNAFHVVEIAPDHAVGSYHEVLVTYFPARVTVEALASVHRAHTELRARHPKGTATLGIVGAGIPVPGRDVRTYAAQIGREASQNLRGECIVIRGHPFWVGMARSALRAIRLVSQSWHPRAIHDEIEPGARWVLLRLGLPSAATSELVLGTEALIDACTKLRERDRALAKLAAAER